MPKNRLEAFSDGVIAIIITIMVLELRAPEGPEWSSLRPLMPIFLSYVMSFTYLGIYWNNHHHLLQATHHVTGSILWANLHLLFWMSLTPFATAWMGETHFAAMPVAIYGGVLLLTAVSYWILARRLIAVNGQDSALARALGSDYKGKVSLGLYAASVPLAFVATSAALSIYVLVGLMWLIPDRRLERVVSPHGA